MMSGSAVATVAGITTRVIVFPSTVMGLMLNVLGRLSEPRLPQAARNPAESRTGRNKIATRGIGRVYEV